MRKRARALLGASGLLLMLAAAPAYAVNFVLIDTGGAGAGTAALAGFQAAANFWASKLKDNVTVTLDVGFAALSPGIIGQTSMNTAAVYTSDVYAALAADQTTALDHAAVASLRPLSSVTSGPNAGDKQLTMTVNQTQASTGYYSDKATRVDSDGSGNNVALDVTTANLKALGFTTDASAVDASITFNSSFAFDFDPTNGIKKGTIDFVGVAMHEIAHALGFVSGVDTYDTYTQNVKAGGLTKAGVLDPYAIGSTLDLFRYSAPGTVDWSTSANPKYFSLDGGATAYNGNAFFSLGLKNGNRAQASHWLAPPLNSCTVAFVGIMNPYACKSQMGVVTTDDLAALDAIGWDVDPSVFGTSSGTFTSASAFTKLAIHSVPEPATWVELLLGFGALGAFGRRRRKLAAA
jgi:hypothetical protein